MEIVSNNVAPSLKWHQHESLQREGGTTARPACGQELRDILFLSAWPLGS